MNQAYAVYPIKDEPPKLDFFTLLDGKDAFDAKAPFLRVELGRFKEIRADGLPWLIALIRGRDRRGLRTTVALPLDERQDTLKSLGLRTLLSASKHVDLEGDYGIDNQANHEYTIERVSDIQQLRSDILRSELSRLLGLVRGDSTKAMEPARGTDERTDMQNHLACIVQELHDNVRGHVHGGLGASGLHSNPPYSSFVYTSPRAHRPAEDLVRSTPATGFIVAKPSSSAVRVCCSDFGIGLLASIRGRISSGVAPGESLDILRNDREALIFALCHRAVNWEDRYFGLIQLCEKVLQLRGLLCIASGDSHFTFPKSGGEHGNILKAEPLYKEISDKRVRMKRVREWLETHGELKSNPVCEGVHIYIRIPVRQ